MLPTGTPGAVHLCLPFDTQKDAVDEAEIWAEARHKSFPADRSAPDPAAIVELATRAR